MGSKWIALIFHRSLTLSTLSALNLFVAWIKVFKYLSFNATMTQLSQTLTSVSDTVALSINVLRFTQVPNFQAGRDLAGFAVMFFIIFLAFTQLGYLLFGTQGFYGNTQIQCKESKLIQAGYVGFNTGNGEKLSYSQAVALVWL